MPILTGSVGKGGSNWIHDVAVVQGALATLTGADRRPFWQGPIDGRKGKPLEDAIAVFQHSNRMNPTARLNQSGAEINRMESALPPGRKGMRAVRGTPTLWRYAGQAPRWRAIAKDAKDNAPLPLPERKALGELIERIARSTGVALVPEDFMITADGRFRVTLIAPGIEWYDTYAKRFRRDLRTPDPVTRAMNQAGQANVRWRQANTNDSILVLDAQIPIAALRGANTLDSKALPMLGLTAPPKNPLAAACLAGCARLIQTDMHRTGTSATEFATLIEVAERAEPGLSVTVNEDPENGEADFTAEEFEAALTAFVGEASAWAATLEIEGAARDWYVRTIRQEAANLLEQYRSGQISIEEAKDASQYMRAKFLEDARARGTSFGRIIAESLKKEVPHVSYYEDKYALKQFGKEFSELSYQEKVTIWEIIVDKSGVANEVVTERAHLARTVARGLFIMSFAIATLEVLTAENRAQEAARQSSIMAGGAAGSLVGGIAGSAVASGAIAGLGCGPFAPICATAGVVIGGILGAFGAEFIFDELSE